jgi:PAS domain S-box-containing protein
VGDQVPFDIKQQDSFTFITDENGAFISLSPAVYYVLGYQPAELLGKSFVSIATVDSYGRASAIMYQMLQGRLPFRGDEIGLLCKDGRALETEISGRPITEQGLFHGYQGVVLAISEYLLPQAAPGLAMHETELLLDLVCHDINNLNQVQIGYLEFALESMGPDNPAYGYIEKCLVAATGSSGLLRNVQKLQQIGTGARTLEKVDLGSILAEAIVQSSNGRGRDVRINFTRDFNYQVMANALLKDAFLNILGNAIKHNIGYPVIDVFVKKVTDSGRELCLVTIDDNGSGIPDEMKRRLFNRFERGVTPASGKGLGLYLVRKLIEGYAGHVWVEDRVQGDHSHGSRFVIALPLADR